MKALGLIIKILALLALAPQAEADIGTVDFTKLSIFGSGCKIDGEEIDTRSPALIMREAQNFFDTKKFCKAAQGFAQVRRQAPSGDLFPQAQFKLVQSLYSEGEFDQAITEAKEYLYWHPQFPEAEEITIIMARSFYQDRGAVQADQSWTLKAQKAFKDYLDKYPEGKFAEEAREKMKSSYEEQADKELVIARHYLKLKKYTAAALRLEYMASMYKASSRVPEALALVSGAYLALGKVADARVVYSVLMKSFPSSPWTTRVRMNLSIWETDRDLGKIQANLKP